MSGTIIYTPFRRASKPLSFLLTLLFTLIFAAPGVSWGATYVVNTTDDTHDAVLDGTCADTTGACSLRAAIDEANAGLGEDIIRFDPTTDGNPIKVGYKSGQEDLNYLGDFDIWQPVAIVGNGTDKTIIDGNGASTGDRVFHVTTDVLVYFENLTITGGGAIDHVGGGILNYYGIVKVSGCQITDNRAANGGGIFNWDGRLYVYDSTISDNVAMGLWFGHGGGIGFSNGVSAPGFIKVDNTIVTGNHADGLGGGIDTYHGKGVIRNSIIASNTSGADGGGLHLEGSIVDLEHTTIRKNSSGRHGGGIRSSSLLEANNITVSDNTAERGGGIFFQANLQKITNSTISNNIATIEGGGAYNNSSDLTASNITITANSATTGGGIFSDFSSGWGGFTSLSNSIVANQTFGDDCIGTIAYTQYDLDSDGTCDVWFTDDPLLAGLAYNGGSTMTHALLEGSPAIDSGSCVNATDQRGVTRPQGVTCDIGAYEAVE